MLVVRPPFLHGTDRYRNAVVDLAPVSYWRMNESSGSRAYDQMGRANATYNNLVQGVSGPIVDGAAAKGVLAGSTYLDGGSATFPQTAYTLMIWLYLTAVSADKGLFGRWSANAGSFLWIDAGTGVSLFHKGVGTSLRPAVALPGLRWHFIVGTWNGTTQWLYQNGLLIGTRAESTAPGSPTNNWWAGTYNNTNTCLTGSMAEAAYWDRALTAGDVANLYALGSGR